MTKTEKLALMAQAHEFFSDKELVAEYKKAYNTNLKDVTDGHHTYEELYAGRRELSNIIFQTYSDFAWKTRKHSDGEIWDGLFIVGISIPDVGDYTYHYHTEFWDEFDVKEIEHAPEYDGHTDKDIDRLFALLKYKN